jgi:hypothetical protein
MTGVPAKKAAAKKTAPAKKAAAPAKKTAAKVTSPRSGLVLDPADPDDAKIMARQVQAARKAGASGGDRAGIDQSRPDLLAAFDEGAGKPAAAPADQGPGKAGKAGAAAGNAGKKAAGFLSKGSWRPTLQAPARPRDAGGLLAGMFLWVGVSVYLRYGPAGWKGWLSAKFLNKPMQGLPTPAGTKGVTAL